jgi:cell division protein ZapA (FtsZ GTPase activity inhibitor)
MPGTVVENKVIVNIFGEEYPITAPNDPAYIARIADFVDCRMKELAKISRTKAKDKLAILTALSIASELLEKSETVNGLEEQYSARIDRLVARLDESLAEFSSGKS